VSGIFYRARRFHFLLIDNEILFVIDGAKGIYKGIKDALS
jgi:hypothetical protein